MIATLTAAAILFAGSASIRAARDASADPWRAVSSAPALVALHSTAAHQLVLQSRSSARRLPSVVAPMPAHSYDARPGANGHHVGAAGAIAHIGAPVVRGYDATAPPALS